MSLEELILRHAAGRDIPSFDRVTRACGVMMIPIPKAGTLKSVSGIEEANNVDGIDGISIAAKLNYPINPLPEGASYLGFIFARGEQPGDVELALRKAHDLLQFKINSVIPIKSG